MYSVLSWFSLLFFNAQSLFSSWSFFRVFFLSGFNLLVKYIYSITNFYKFIFTNTILQTGQSFLLKYKLAFTFWLTINHSIVYETSHLIAM